MDCSLSLEQAVSCSDTCSWWDLHGLGNPYLRGGSAACIESPLSQRVISSSSGLVFANEWIGVRQPKTNCRNSQKAEVKSGTGHKQLTPNLLGFQVANTWTKITARDGYAMVRNGKEPENP